MIWWKLITFIVMAMNCFKVHSESNLQEKCEMNLLNATASACRNNELHLLINWNSSLLSNLEIKSDEQNCYTFNKTENNLFVMDTTNKTQKFCEMYDLYVSRKIAYYIKGSNLEQVNECPNRTEVCIKNSCPLNNIDVVPMWNSKDEYINLNISWESALAYNANLGIYPVEGNDLKKPCYFTTLTEIHLSNKTILVPNFPSDTDIETLCPFKISLEWNNSTCETFYTIPECVEEKCDCEKYRSDVNITQIKHIIGHKYLVTWDFSPKSQSNETVEFKSIFFRLYRNDLAESNPQILKLNQSSKSAQIEMNLWKNDSYTLTGFFQNKFTCFTPASFVYQNSFEEEVGDNRNIFIFVTSIVIVGLIIIIAFVLNKYWIRLRDIFLKLCRKHDLTSERPHIAMSVNPNYVPLDQIDEFEFPSENIILKEKIGKGAFGDVYSAKSIGVLGVQGYEMVAVKTLAEANMSEDARDDFMAEIEIFKTVGKHQNIVTLLGCCTKEVPYMMIMELVPCGDLKKYLVDLRSQWVIKRQELVNDKQIFFSDSSDGSFVPISPISLASFHLPSSAVSTPSNPRTPLLANFTVTRILDHTELQDFALQIAKGMAHLESIHITHRDLAARNVLISESKVLKISDFGLSRCGPYVNQRSKRLPLRWMAPEAITEHRYDSRSDVWSFGIVLWEIGTLGAFPYEQVPDSFMVQFLQMGRRLMRPEICTDELYALMERCWHEEPVNRPTFAELVKELDVEEKKIYVNFEQLNPTYVFPPSDVSVSDSRM